LRRPRARPPLPTRRSSDLDAMSDPYVIVGVARTRQGWFSEVARWSTSGAAPVEFLKCLTTDEARALLGSGRRASALLVDAATPGDRKSTRLNSSHVKISYA